jgi:hypothetical protein
LIEGALVSSVAALQQLGDTMETRDRLIALDHRPATQRHLLLLGLWMRSVAVGAAFAIAGVAALIDPPQGITPLAALALIVAGGAFAWLAWRRTIALLARVDDEVPTPSRRVDVSPMPRVSRMPASS